MDFERNTLSNGLLDKLIKANVKIKYLRVNLTNVGEKVYSKHPGLSGNYSKDITFTFNGLDNIIDFESDLKLSLKRLNFILKDKFNDKDYYLKEFKLAYQKIKTTKGKRETLYTRTDLKEYQREDSEFWIDEVDEFILLLKKRRISDFIKIQKLTLEKIIQLLEPIKSIQTIEDLIPNEDKRLKLKEWLLEKNYCTNESNFMWTSKSRGKKTYLAFILAYIIPFQKLSNVSASNKILVKVAENSFNIELSVETIQQAVKNLKLRSEFKNLRI